MTDALTIAPTPERMQHAGALIEEPEVNQHRARRAFRVVSLVASMHARGSINDDCLRAFERFEQDWAVAHRVPSAVAPYGERFGSASDMDDTSQVRKDNARRRSAEAMHAIGSPHARRALLMAVCPRPADATSTMRPYSLEEIGRACSTYTSKMHAVTVGNVVLRDALWQLHLHYEVP